MPTNAHSSNHCALCPPSGPLPLSTLNDLAKDIPPGGSCTLLRREEAIALVSSALKVLQVGYVDRGALRAYARQILTFQDGLLYRYEDPIDELAEDFAWLMG